MKFFIRNLENSQWRVREESAEALGEIGDKLAVEPLINSLNDDDWHVREAASLSLGILDDDRAVVPLLKMLKDEKDM
jgi:HEAT repeat protein